MTDPDATDPQHQSPGGDTTFITSISGAKHSFLPGDIVDGVYQLRASLGQGGMGVVFSCRHLVMGTDYAIKILSGEQLTEEYWTRFCAEARALARLKHPNIVSIHNMGVDGGQFPYFVMDLLSGQTLDVLLGKRGSLPVDEALDISIQLADALGSAHAHGIIHRDVKPSNIIVLVDGHGAKGMVKIVDFGIARLSKQGLPSQSQTKTGVVFGTPLYMSPEQCQGIRVDERSDIYSLGCTLFECLTGNPPFSGDNRFHTFMMHQTKPPPRLVQAAPNGNFPEALERAVGKMLAKGPTERYQAMAQVQHDLERIRAGKTIMAQGLASPPAIAEGQTAYGEKREPAGDDFYGRRSGLPALKIAAMTLVAILLCAGACYAAFNYLRPRGAAAPAPVLGSDVDIVTMDEIGHATTFEQIKEQTPILEKRLRAYRANRLLSSAPLMLGKPRGFSFPRDFSVGAVKIGDDKPVLAMGFISCPLGKRVYLYLTKCTESWPEFLDKFGADDINALELRTDNPLAVIKVVSKWNRLDELCFFNSLLKAVPDPCHPKDKDNEAGCDESVLNDRVLRELDKLTNLKTLGLCGVHVDGEAIINMALFKTINALKLKRINNIQKVLAALPARDNLHELWLGGQDTTDKELEPLTQMKNLETLRIRRSLLTPGSLKFFKQMPALKHLYLDREWSEETRDRFKRELSCYEYEVTYDQTYWTMIPDQ